MNDKLRSKIKEKYGGKCAYCGRELGKSFAVDHIQPIFRGRVPREEHDNSEGNLNPACHRCNRRKSTLSIEGLRSEIGEQAKRLRRDSAAFRLAEDYNVVEATEKPIEFYFERYNKAVIKQDKTQ